MSFGVGDLVVCVDDGPSGDGVPVPLSAGSIYTIAEFIPQMTYFFDIDGKRKRSAEDLCLVAEVAPIPPRPKFTSRFRACRFRPVRKTDISIFTSMLVTPPKEKVNENA